MEKHNLLLPVILFLIFISCSGLNSENAHEPSIWLNQTEIDDLPTQGESFEYVVNFANSGLKANLFDQDNDHNNQTYAQALLCARDVDQVYCDMAIQGIIDAMHTQGEAHMLALGRNLAAYVIAADLTGYRDPQFIKWLDEIRHKEISGRTLISTHERRPNNHGTVAGASRIAASAFLGDESDVASAAQIFHDWLGNREVYTDFVFGGPDGILDWQANPDKPVGINPPGSTKEGHNIDGVLPDEMRRCGDGSFKWPPCRTGYNWGGMQGAVLQAELLHRQGYPAWEWESKALLRAASWLYNATADDGDTYYPRIEMRWQPWLINKTYDTNFKTERATPPGKNMGFTDWTHGL
ncbi:MAG: alginate lyase family protein [Balneolales bacterium]